MAAPHGPDESGGLPTPRTGGRGAALSLRAKTATSHPASDRPQPRSWGRGGRDLTVSSPFIPPSASPGTVQRKVHLPGVSSPSPASWRPSRREIPERWPGGAEGRRRRAGPPIAPELTRSPRRRESAPGRDDFRRRLPIAPRTADAIPGEKLEGSTSARPFDGTRGGARRGSLFMRCRGGIRTRDLRVIQAGPGCEGGTTLQLPPQADHRSHRPRRSATTRPEKGSADRLGRPSTPLHLHAREILDRYWTDGPMRRSAPTLLSGLYAGIS